MDHSLLFCASVFVFSFFTVGCIPMSRQHDPIEGNLIEGDIAFEGGDKTLATIENFGVSYWPKGVVPYVIQTDDFNSLQIATIQKGMRTIESQTETRPGEANCIRFVPRTNESVYLKIFYGTGCWSNVGKNRFPGPQELSLGSGCAYVGTVIHELTHAIGFWHEQSRPDRDDYVTIQLQNVIEASKHNFDKKTFGINKLDLPYDILSIMHYESYAFSMNNKPTIIPKVPGFSTYDLLASYDKYRYSELDIQAVRKLYKCAL